MRTYGGLRGLLPTIKDTAIREALHRLDVQQYETAGAIQKLSGNKQANATNEFVVDPTATAPDERVGISILASDDLNGSYGDFLVLDGIGVQPKFGTYRCYIKSQIFSATDPHSATYVVLEYYDRFNQPFATLELTHTRSTHSGESDEGPLKEVNVPISFSGMMTPIVHVSTDNSPDYQIDVVFTPI